MDNEHHTLIMLLRGINVGGHKKVPMAKLRALSEALGFTQVRTYIQTGNLLLSTHLEPKRSPYGGA